MSEYNLSAIVEQDTTDSPIPEYKQPVRIPASQKQNPKLTPLSIFIVLLLFGQYIYIFSIADKYFFRFCHDVEEKELCFYAIELLFEHYTERISQKENNRA
jgi:hypothetical protein